MEAKIWVHEAEFNDSTKIQFGQNDIIVFVGPNNAGKSVSLKEISALIVANNRQQKVVKNISIRSQGTETDLVNTLQLYTKKTTNSDPSPYYSGIGFNLYEPNVRHWWSNLQNGASDLSKFFINSISTEDRLTIANPTPSINLIAEAPKHPIHFLQKSDALEQKFSSYFKQAFGLDLLVHRNAGNVVPLYVGQKPIIKDGQDRLSEAYQVQLEKLDILHKQGDGMRSFVGVLLNAFISHYSIVFVDEPEAFLHPPQARILGKMLSKDLPSERQLFLATHSADFLKGLLDSGNQNLKIIRLNREGGINRVSVLNNSGINAIWNDSLLRHSNILDGLFHTQVIVCESDSDCRFYSAILAAVYEVTNAQIPDVLFVHCGGKHRIPTVVKALKQLNVTIKIIVDFDVLNDSSPLKDIYQEAGGTWEPVARDWKIVKDAIESKRPELETKDLKTEIDNVFASTPERIIPKEKISTIQKALKKASAWSHAKEIGKSFIPGGDATQAFERLQNYFRSTGLFIVEVGELEGFVKSVGNHGPKWVNEVLVKDLAKDNELLLARQFVLEVTK